MENTNALIYKTLSQDAYWNVNKAIAAEYGIVPTCLLSHLMSLSVNFFKNNNFYQKQEIIMKVMNISRRELENALKVLSGKTDDKELLPLLEITKRGLPSKSYYTILWKNVEQVLKKPVVEYDEETKYGDGQHRTNVADLAVQNERTNKNKEKKKKESSSTQQNEYLFTEPNEKELERKQKEDNLQKDMNWTLLNSLWTTNEYSHIVKNYKKDWSKLTLEQQDDIISFCQKNKAKLQDTTIWKKDFFRTDGASLASLQAKLDETQSRSASKMNTARPINPQGEPSKNF